MPACRIFNSTTRGILYGAAGGGEQTSELITINQFTGLATDIGSIGFSAVSGLAYRQEHPQGSHIAISPLSIEFNQTGVNFSSAARRVTIRSNGTENLTVSAINGPGTPFILTNLPSLPAEIPPAGTVSFDVTFSPASADTFYEAITISSDDPENPEIELALSGIGVAIGLAEVWSILRLHRKWREWIVNHHRSRQRDRDFGRSHRIEQGTRAGYQFQWSNIWSGWKQRRLVPDRCRQRSGNINR